MRNGQNWWELAGAENPYSPWVSGPILRCFKRPESGLFRVHTAKDTGSSPFAPTANTLVRGLQVR